MIKITKKVSQREKSNNIQSFNTQKNLKQKSKNTAPKKFSSSKQKLNPLKTQKNLIESKFTKKRNHNSISSKEEVSSKFLTRPKTTKLKSNLENYNTYGNKNTNNNKLFTSNLFLTNDTDIQIIDEEKKIKKTKFSNNNEEKILNLPEVETIFKKNNYKKTIIIDNEGNNNLHMNIKKGENDYKKILNNKINNKSIFGNSSINANTETNSLFTNDSKMEPSKLAFNNKIINPNLINENEIKENIIDNSINKEKNEEDKRIKEYNKIFNLLNSNIEQFKKMFSSNTYKNKVPNQKEKEKEKNNQNNNPKNKSKKILIQNKRITQPKKPRKQGSKSVNKNKNNSEESSLSKKSQKNLIKNLSEKNISSSSKRLKTCQNIFTADVRNDIEKDLNSDKKIIKNETNNAISSFLESSLQEDFYQSLINRDFSNLMEEDKIMKDDIMSINIDEKGKDENIQDIQDSRIFKAKFENENANEEINKKEEKKEDKTNCNIF